jgi:hypothetical protein
MRGHGHRRMPAAFSSVRLGVAAAFLVILGLLGMHGLSSAHAGMPQMQSAATNSMVHPASHQAAIHMGEEAGCPPQAPCPAASTGTVCFLAPPSVDGSHVVLPSGQPAVQPALGRGDAFSYRGPPAPAPSLQQLSISRT